MSSRRRFTAVRRDTLDAQWSVYRIFDDYGRGRGNLCLLAGALGEKTNWLFVQYRIGLVQVK
jgi:hypothetical protein